MVKQENRSGETEARGTMAAGPGVSMQSGSPARELSLSVQQAGNQTHGDRGKAEEVTGKNMPRFITSYVLLIIVIIMTYVVAQGDTG